MGAWGEGVLENDTAVDWLGDLEEQPQLETVTIALGDEVTVQVEKVDAARGRVDLLPVAL